MVETLFGKLKSNTKKLNRFGLLPTTIKNHNLLLTLNVPCISESCIKIKIKLNFYFHTSLWCLKRFYENLFSSPGIGTGRVKKQQMF